MHFNEAVYKSPLLHVLAFSLLIFSELHSQKIEHVGGKKYQYKEQIYKYNEMDHVFRQNEFSYNEFQKTVSKRKIGKTLGFVSLGGIGLGVVGGIAAGESDDISGLSVVSLGFIIFSAAGTAAIIAKSGSKKLEKRSVDIFNQNAPEVSSANTNSMNLELGLFSNGRLGIVINF